MINDFHRRPFRRTADDTLQSQAGGGGRAASGAMFAYVSNSGDGDIGVYRLLDSGVLQKKGRAAAASLVGPLAVSPDRRFLYAASRSTPYTAHVYAIDQATGGLKPLATTPLIESLPYIFVDATGRFLLGASYGGHIVTVNAISSGGQIAPTPQQVIPVGRNAHSIRADNTNRFVYVPNLGTDQIFQFVFEQETGQLASNTPAVVQMKPNTGPRHFVISPDNRFVFLLSELVGTVTTLSMDQHTGLLTELSVAPMLPPDSKLKPGGPRTPGTQRDTENDIWAADIHMTPDARFLYASERTSSTLAAFAVDDRTGKLTYLRSTVTEKQPRGFAIDPKGRFLLASGEMSDTLSVYAIDAVSGDLALLGKYPTGKGSNWIEIVRFE